MEPENKYTITRKQLDIFRAAKDALVLQGEPSIYFYKGTKDCAYRGNGGLKCAIGHIIRDGDYSRYMEGSSAGSSMTLAAIEKVTGPIDKDFVTRFQEYCHDNLDAVEPDGWAQAVEQSWGNLISETLIVD